MTDKEIIKALEYCINNNGICEDCPLLNKMNSSKECTDEMIRGALTIINRQKAEIEKLKKEKDEMHKDVIVAEEYAWSLKTAKSEAIRKENDNAKL